MVTFEGSALQMLPTGTGPHTLHSSFAPLSSGYSTHPIERTQAQLLRDRILWTARSERQRCLASAGLAPSLPELTSAESQTDFTLVHRGVQTEPLTQDGAVAPTETWSAADDDAQSEALRMLRLLGERRDDAPDEISLRARVAELEAQLSIERQRHELRLEAAQRQVLCLEAELDRAEATLVSSERTLQQRDGELHIMQHQLQEARCSGLLPSPERACVEDLRAANSRQTQRALARDLFNTDMAHLQVLQHGDRTSRLGKNALRVNVQLSEQDYAEHGSDASEYTGTRFCGSGSTCALSSPSSSVASSSVYAAAVRR